MSASEGKSIDWGQVRQRVDAARQATERGWSPSSEEKRRILRGRARVLAAAPPEAPVAETRIEVVTFLLGGERYGIELSFVREVYPLKAFTPLPCTPAFVLGIVNVRGQILSVIDLGRFFDLPAMAVGEPGKVIILRRGEMELGILAQAILGVQSVPRDEIHPGMPTLTGVRQAYLMGITAARLAVLDGGSILADRNLVVNEQVE
jgi:purine-binding chemotaxis protein CheW